LKHMLSFSHEASQWIVMSKTARRRAVKDKIPLGSNARRPAILP